MKKITMLSGLLALFFACADYDLYNDNKPPESQLSVADVHDTTVALRWTQCTDENFKNYKVYFDSTDVVDLSDKLLDSLSFAQDTMKTVRNLKPSTMYYFRVFVTNQAGKTNASNTVSAITWLSASSQQTGDSAVLLKWTPLRNAQSNGYYLYSDSTDRIDTLSVRETQSPVTDTSYTINNLAAGKVRRFRVYSAVDGGYGTPSNIVRVNGWDFKLFKPDSISDSSVKLHWARVKDASKYRVFRNVKLPVDTTSTPCATITDTFTTVGKISPDTTYLFKVYAQKNDGAIIGWTKPDSVRLK